MHFLQSENRAAGHALLLLTLEANNNIRENKNRRGLSFLLSVHFCRFVSNSRVLKVWPPACGQSLLAHFSCDKTRPIGEVFKCTQSESNLHLTSTACHGRSKGGVKSSKQCHEGCLGSFSGRAESQKSIMQEKREHIEKHMCLYLKKI